jgi:hypothetical protein
VFFLADTIALDIDKELNIIDIIDIRPASSINLQKLIAAGVVTINPATAPQINLTGRGNGICLARQLNQKVILQQAKRQGLQRKTRFKM